MNSLMMLMLLQPNLLTGLTAGMSGGMSSLLPLMLLSGGRGIGTMGMIGLMTGNPMLTIMGLTQRKRYRRRRSGSAYWKGYTRGLLNAR